MSNFDVTQIVLNHSSRDSVENFAPVIEINREWKAGFFSTVYRFFKFNYFLLKLKPKVLILNCELAELYGAFSIFTGKIIAVEHTNKPWNGREKIGFIVRWILLARRVNWVRVSSLIQIWPYKNTAATTIENPVARLKKRKSTENQRIDRLAYVGRFTLQKRTNFLSAIAKSTNRDLILIGDGESLDSVLKECRENSVQVTSHGFVKNPWQLVPPNSLLLNPSGSEGDGLVVIEAVLGNVPFLISDIAEFRRFGFPDRNYCSVVDDFIDSIASYEAKLYELEIPKETSRELEKLRKPFKISKK